MARRALTLAALALLAGLAAAETYEFGYDSYGDSYGDSYSSSYLEDDLGYYGSDDDSYYEEYGFYSDDGDAFGYADYYEEYEDDYGSAGTTTIASLDAGATCTLDAAGKAKLANGTASCDIRIAGVDKQADLLPGGIDGVYKLSGCHDGRPLYKRAGSPAGEERVLWYSKSFTDWDISRGPAPTEDDILMYGSDMEQHAVPLHVVSWHIGGDLKSGPESVAMDEEVYVPVTGAALKCADGTVVKPPRVTPAQQKVRPVLTPEELEQKYKLIYERYNKRPEPNPNVNFSFVIMLVMIGLTIVLAIPYALVRRGRPSAKGYQPVAASFAQVIQQSKKRSSGHVH